MCFESKLNDGEKIRNAENFDEACKPLLSMLIREGSLSLLRRENNFFREAKKDIRKKVWQKTKKGTQDSKEAWSKKPKRSTKKSKESKKIHKKLHNARGTWHSFQNFEWHSFWHHCHYFLTYLRHFSHSAPKLFLEVSSKLYGYLVHPSCLETVLECCRWLEHLLYCSIEQLVSAPTATTSALQFFSSGSKN